MFANMSKAVIWPVTVIVLFIFGCLTFLAYERVVAGSDVLVITISILSALGVGLASHVGAQNVTNAVNGALHGDPPPVVTVTPVTKPELVAVSPEPPAPTGA